MQDIHLDKQFPKLPFFSSLKGRLIRFFLAVSLIPLILVGLLTFYLARQELRTEAFNKLETVRDAKAEQIDTYFDATDRDIRLLSQLDLINEAYHMFSTAIAGVGLQDVRELGFLGNPNQISSETHNAYSVAHQRYYDLLSNIVEARDYMDILLVSGTGDVVYSYAKRDDFATNLLDGPYRDTELANLVRGLIEDPVMYEIRMTDFAPYPPAGRALVSFVGIHFVDDHGVTGILVFALPISVVEDLMRSSASGDASLKTYLVNENKRINSTAGFYFEESLVANNAVEAGLAGQTGTMDVEDEAGVVLSAYQPIERGGLKWVLLVEQAEEEAIETATELSVWMLGILVVTTVLVILAGLFVTFRIAGPITRLTTVAQQVSGGNLEVQAAVESQDEIGQLAQAFDTMTSQLRTLIGSLEEQVQERTTELAASVEIGQRATVIRNLDELLPNITTFIRDRFELHYVQVFLVDDINQNLVLRAGTGQAGQELLADNFSLPINIDTAVGRSVVENQSIVVADTTVGYIETSQHMPSAWYSALIRREQRKKPASLLPETLSELAIPLMVEGQVLGVLDLQDDKLKSFAEKDLSVYEAIALQLSFSIDSAKQWALTQEAHKRAEEAIRQLTREAWAERLASSKDSAGFVYDLSRIASLLPDAYSLTATPENGCSAPLVVQDQTIGYLSVRTPGDRDLTEDEQVLLQAVAQQLAQKAENLRLFEATQQRASREQIARRIIDRVRASRNIEMALRTAAEELNKALGTARAVVDLQVMPEPIPAEEQNVDSAEIKSAPEVSSVNDRPDEASMIRRYGHGGLL